MEPIGGYFSLELPQHEEYHKDAIRLNTGRNCLEYILRVRQYKKVYIPYYTCGVVLEPFRKLNIPYEFYHINILLELAQEIRLNQGEALLYTNYYGLKQRYVEQLAGRYSRQLIVDNTQAFYAKPISGIDTFYTCRKFFGVPDGAYLYIDKLLNMELVQDVSYDRLSYLAKRIDISPEAAYQDFHNISKTLVGQSIKRMSKLTQRMMKSINYEVMAQIRRKNYFYLRQCLAATNQLHLTMDEDAVPMVYPYLSSIEGLRELLIANKIYVACYWPNVMEWTAKDDIENYFAFQMLPLPIDQRYGMIQMNYIKEQIQQTFFKS